MDIELTINIIQITDTLGMIKSLTSEIASLQTPVNTNTIATTHHLQSCSTSLHITRLGRKKKENSKYSLGKGAEEFPLEHFC